MLETTTKPEDGDLKLINDELYCTIAKAAEICGVSTSTMRRWADLSYQNERNVTIKVLRDPMNHYRYFRYDDLLKLKNRFIEDRSYALHFEGGQTSFFSSANNANKHELNLILRFRILRGGLAGQDSSLPLQFAVRAKVDKNTDFQPSCLQVVEQLCFFA